VRWLSGSTSKRGAESGSESVANPLRDIVQAGAQTLSEVFPVSATDGGALGFVLSMIPKTRAPILWVQDHMSQTEAGRPYLPGMALQRPIIQITLTRTADALWAMEEGLRCAALGAVIGEVWGDATALDFTATKRLAIRAEASKRPCWLVRRGTVPNLSAARNRWRVASLPSLTHPHDPAAPGDPRWRLELFRSRQINPGVWVARYDRAADRVDFSAAFRDGALAEGDGATERRAAG
jgi:protein ImuA